MNSIDFAGRCHARRPFSIRQNLPLWMQGRQVIERPLMPVLEFLESKGKDHSGRSIDDVLAFDDDSLETNHDFIQWLFPLPEPSRAQPSSPILTVQEITAIRASSTAQQNLENAVRRMTLFYERNDHWLRAYDHNHLRITRIVRSLTLLRSTQAAQAFLLAIEGRVEAAGDPVNNESREYWRRALLV